MVEGKILRRQPCRRAIASQNYKGRVGSQQEAAFLPASLRDS